MRFPSRQAAAPLLAAPLQRFASHHPLVLGIPRGGVLIARVVAEGLRCPLDVVLVRKICAPEQPEVAIGAVDEAGRVYPYGTRVAEQPALFADLVGAHVAELRRLRALYSPGRPPVPPAGHTAIVVDDGMVSGATMVAAIRAVRASRPLRVVAAVPVASHAALELVRSYADEVTCLHSPRLFYALVECYDDFAPVLDSDVVAALEARE